jgi:hypothetical protein
MRQIEVSQPRQTKLTRCGIEYFGEGSPRQYSSTFHTVRNEGEIGILWRPGDQDVPQVAHRVALDVVYVAEASKASGDSGCSRNEEKSMSSITSFADNER